MKKEVTYFQDRVIPFSEDKVKAKLRTELEEHTRYGEFDFELFIATFQSKLCSESFRGICCGGMTCAKCLAYFENYEIFKTWTSQNKWLLAEIL